MKKLYLLHLKQNTCYSREKKVHHSLKANHRELPSLEFHKGGHHELPSLEFSKGGDREPSLPKDSTLKDSLVKPPVSGVN